MNILLVASWLEKSAEWEICSASHTRPQVAPKEPKAGHSENKGIRHLSRPWQHLTTVPVDSLMKNIMRDRAILGYPIFKPRTRAAQDQNVSGGSNSHDQHGPDPMSDSYGPRNKPSAT